MINKSSKESTLEKIYKNLESGMPENKSIKEYALPNARQWLGGRFVAIWAVSYTHLTLPTMDSV